MMMGLADSNGFMPQPEPMAPEPWPELNGAALHGLAGEFVEMVEPHSEADPAALLIQFLGLSGSVIGRAPYCIADGAEHHLNLYCLVVGKSSKSRKGTSWSWNAAFFEHVDSAWTSQRIKSGLASGEGLIHHVRDPLSRTDPVKKGGKLTGEYQTYEVDAGVTDKRLMVYEPEFASVLSVCKRENSTLSPVVRIAWESGKLSTMAKHSPETATGAHVSIAAHIVSDELKRHLTATEQVNGFANRFIYICARRSKELPFSSRPPASVWTALAHQVRLAAEKARHFTELQFSPRARELWVSVYHELSGERHGMLGAILARSEAQVLRLSSIYAVLDSSQVIDEQHLLAAVALWQYAEDSAALIFGDSIGDPDADAILGYLRSQPNGATRTDISSLFGRNLSAARLERALATLVGLRLAAFQTEKTAGRPVERWHSISNRRG
jgi:hypothetical protein